MEMSPNQPFFPDIDPKKPSRPERPLNDYDDYEEDYSCPVCSLLISEHKTNQIVECALNEIRGLRRAND